MAQAGAFDADEDLTRPRLRLVDLPELGLCLPADELNGSHPVATPSRIPANFRSAAARRVGTCSLGTPSSGAV